MRYLSSVYASRKKADIYHIGQEGGLSFSVDGRLPLKDYLDSKEEMLPCQAFLGRDRINRGLGI